jgi:hypothetical protein
MRWACACWLAVGVVALAGCGGGGGPKSNGVPDKTATQIIAQMKKDVSNAKSVHITGSGTSGNTKLSLDLQLERGTGGAGHIEIGGYGFDIVRIDNKLYFKADRAALNHFAGAIVARLLAGRWFVVPAGSSGFGSFTPFTDLQKLMSQILTASGRVEKGEETKVGDQPAITLTDTKNGGTLYVATTGPAYPLQLKPGKSKTGTISFTDWDQPVTLTAPKDSLDYAKLTGG